MVVILEGVNKTGKTTLANALTAQADAIYVRSRVSQEFMKSKVLADPATIAAFHFGEMMGHIHWAASATSPIVVFDRFHLSEYVHSCLDRKLTSPYIKVIEQALAQLGKVLVVLCTDSTKNINIRNNRSMDSYVDLMYAIYQESILPKITVKVDGTVPISLLAETIICRNAP